VNESMRTTVYTFKVALKGRTSIWRRIEIRGNQTLDDLHEAIFRAFDREEEHLYSFYFAPPGSRGRARIRDATEYTHPYSLEGPSFFEDGGRHNAAKTRIDALKLRPGRKFEYLFDFGDSWWHEITVERTDGAAQPGRYPRIVESRGKSPPQYPDFDEDQEE
jgi:hypothetical protein